MSTKGTADIVFCLDASGSMGPCIEGVKSHIASLVDGLKVSGQRDWDLRLDYVAHWSISDLHMESLHEHNLAEALYQKSSRGRNQQGARLFTTDIEEFKKGLSGVDVIGDEISLFALDSCLDFPWRQSAECHRVVVFMTDEPTSSGAREQEQKSKLEALMQKIMDLRVMLFIVGPECSVYEELAEVNKSEYEVIDDLLSIDFSHLLAGIGKSVSVSQTSQQSTEPKIRRELYSQSSLYFECVCKECMREWEEKYKPSENYEPPENWEPPEDYVPLR
jgi:hypothetical protein